MINPNNFKAFGLSMAGMALIFIFTDGLNAAMLGCVVVGLVATVLSGWIAGTLNKFAGCEEKANESE